MKTEQSPGRLFTVSERDHIRDWLVQMGKTDKRIVAGALVGGTAEGGDQWSDLDITFGVSKDAKVEDVLKDWTEQFMKQFIAAHLFDLTAAGFIYRVFLTPSNLQVDLSLAPEDQFGATSPRFKPLFGKFLEKFQGLTPTREHIFGLAVHHLVRARLSIERGRFWQAEYWISSARDETFTLMCLERGLPLREGRGYHQLPEELMEPFKKTLVGSLNRQSLSIALRALVDCLRENSRSLGDRVSSIEPQLELIQKDSSSQ